MLLPNFIKGGSKGKGLRRARVCVRLQVEEGAVKAGTETCSYWLLGPEVRLRQPQTSPVLPHREGVRLTQLNASLCRSGRVQLILMIHTGKRF